MIRIMSDIASTGFPDLKLILQWCQDSQSGLCCGIFGCRVQITFKCEICKGWYCYEHSKWHKHTENFDGIIIKND